MSQNVPRDPKKNVCIAWCRKRMTDLSWSLKRWEGILQRSHNQQLTTEEKNQILGWRCKMSVSNQIEGQRYRLCRNHIRALKRTVDNNKNLYGSALPPTCMLIRPPQEWYKLLQTSPMGYVFHTNLTICTQNGCNKCSSLLKNTPKLPQGIKFEPHRCTAISEEHCDASPDEWRIVKNDPLDPRNIERVQRWRCRRENMSSHTPGQAPQDSERYCLHHAKQTPARPSIIKNQYSGCVKVFLTSLNDYTLETHYSSWEDTDDAEEHELLTQMCSMELLTIQLLNNPLISTK